MRFVNVFIFILRTILGTQVERRKKPRTCCTRDLPDQLRLSGLTPGNKRLPVKIRHRSMKYFKIQCCSQTSEPRVLCMLQCVHQPLLTLVFSPPFIHVFLRHVPLCCLFL